MSVFKEQREQLKYTILDTAIKLFKVKGYENTSIESITKEVGIAKGTFYNFYNSKYDILLVWVVNKFQVFDFLKNLNQKHNIEENLTGFIDVMVDGIKEEENLFRNFLKEGIRLQSDKKLAGQLDFLQIYRKLIEGSKDFEAVTAPLEPRIEVLNNSLFMGLIQWFDEGRTVEGLKEYLHSLIHVCLYGFYK